MDFVKYDTSERIARISLNRPEKRNALNEALISGLTDAFKKAEADEQVKVIILKAEGEVFSAGADLEYLQQLHNNTHEENIADSNKLKDLFYTVYSSSKITLAQVEGHAIAGGCGLATVCDIIFSVPGAKFGYTEVKIGFIPALVSAFLIRKIGEGRARELLLSGALISAQTAREYGLINFITERSAIRETVSDYAAGLCTGTSAGSVQLTKQLLSDTQDLPLLQALDKAVHANAGARRTDGFRRGVEGFLKGDIPHW